MDRRTGFEVRLHKKSYSVGANSVDPRQSCDLGASVTRKGRAQGLVSIHCSSSNIVPPGSVNM